MSRILLLISLMTCCAGALASATPTPSAQWWESAFDADVYSSSRSAAFALGRRWGAELISRLGQPPATLYIRSSKPLDDETRQNLLQGLQAELEATRIEIISIKGPITAEGESKPLMAALQIRASSSKEGSLELVTTDASIPQVRVSTRFQSKAWAEELSQFMEKQPHRNWIVVDSGNPQPSPKEATISAAWFATDALMPLVRTRLRSGRAHWSNDDDQLVRTMLHAEFSTRRRTADVFIQSFARPYGTVWREAMLIDTSSRNVDSLTSELARRLEDRRDAIWTTAGSVIGVLLAAYLLYLLLNSFTKGYFTGSLRLTAAALAVAIILLIVVTI